MNARDLIEQLSPLAGHRVRITDVDGNEHEQRCVSVDYLPPRYREAGQGNVIMWNGSLTLRGAEAGFTMMAGNALSVDWKSGNSRVMICLKPRSRQCVYIEVLE